MSPARVRVRDVAGEVRLFHRDDQSQPQEYPRTGNNSTSIRRESGTRRFGVDKQEGKRLAWLRYR
jgi:hypothetical protein